VKQPYFSWFELGNCIHWTLIPINDCHRRIDNFHVKSTSGAKSDVICIDLDQRFLGQRWFRVHGGFVPENICSDEKLLSTFRLCCSANITLQGTAALGRRWILSCW